MKKIVLAAAILLANSIDVIAGEYELEVQVNQMCETMGNIAADAYRAKANHKPKPKLPDGLTDTAYYSNDFGYDKAGSAKDAYMNGWAHCKDDWDDFRRKSKHKAQFGY